MREARNPGMCDHKNPLTSVVSLYFLDKLQKSSSYFRRRFSAKWTIIEFLFVVGCTHLFYGYAQYFRRFLLRLPRKGTEVAFFKLISSEDLCGTSLSNDFCSLEHSLEWRRKYDVKRGSLETI